MAMQEPEGTGGSTGDPRVAAGLEHLQRAALEMIGAARAFLDVMEELVTDEEKVAEVVDAVGAATRAAARAMSQPADGAENTGDRRIQRIDVS